MKRLPLLLLLGAVPHLSAEPGFSPETIREGEAKQQQLRGEAQRLVGQLDGMLGEYERNGLGGDESKTVQALRDSLRQLSVEEMRGVVELLEKARATSNAGEAKQRVADAYAGQKAILTRIQKMLAEHLRQQQAQELAAQLAKLAERQAANLQNGVALGQWSGGKKPENFEAALQANLQGQQAEQLAIAEELRLAAQRVATFARDPENGELAERLKQGLAAIAQVQPKVDYAAEALRNGQLFKAVEQEKVARDELRRLAREIAPPQNRADALRAGQKELAQAIAEQKKILEEAAQAAGEKDFDRGVAALENQQGDLAGKGDELAQALRPEAPAAAQEVKAAVEKMQEARGAMMDRNAPVAARNGQDALAALQAAEARLQQELAKTEAPAGPMNAAANQPPAPDPAAMKQAAAQLAQAQAALQRADEALQKAQQADAAAQQAQVAAEQAQQAAQAAQEAGDAAAAADAKQQAQAAKQEAAAQQAAGLQAAKDAAAQLGEAAKQAGQAAAQTPGMSAAQQPAQQAAEASTQGAAQARAQNLPGAQAQTAAAQQALVQAQAALGQAQAGVTAASSPGSSASPGAPGQPGNQPGSTPGTAGAQAAEQVSQEGKEPVQTGARTLANQKGLFTGLPPRERAVIEQAQAEKYPEEYRAEVEQYLLNLARESAAKK